MLVICLSCFTDYKVKSPKLINKPGFISLSWSSPDNMKNPNLNYLFKYRLLPEEKQEVVKLHSSLHQFGFPTSSHIGRRYEIELATVTGNIEGRSQKFHVRSGIVT